jgi:hypothetical protein
MADHLLEGGTRMRTRRGVSLIGLLISVVIMLVLMYLMLSGMGDEFGASSGSNPHELHELLNNDNTHSSDSPNQKIRGLIDHSQGQ